MRRGRDVQALGGAVALSLACGLWSAAVLPPQAVAPQTLRDVADAVVQPTTGISHQAVSGQRLRPGDALVTGAGGHATLLSPGRRLLVGPGSTVVVGGDDSSYDVRAGQVGLEVREGGAVDLNAGLVTARTVGAPTIVRVDRSYAVRVAALQGAARLEVSGGAQLQLAALEEAVVPGVLLPAVSSPLSVVDVSPNGLEARLVPELAKAQIALDRLASAVDADPVAPVIFSVTATPLAPVSESALPRAIGTAGSEAGQLVSARIARATGLRQAGAAWSVVAARLAARTDQVAQVLSAMLTQPAPVALGPGGPLSAGAPGGPSTPSRASTAPAARVRPPRHATPTSPGPGASPSAQPTPSPAPSPTRSPTPSPSPSGIPDLLGTLGGLIGGVLSPSPT